MEPTTPSFPFRRLAIVLGAVLIVLLAVDGAASMNSADFGIGTGSYVEAERAAALFLIGLVIGMITGIGTFFAYLIWRERKYREEPTEVDLLLEELAAEEDGPLFVEENTSSYSSSEEKSESLDPWERSADWWKQSEE